VTGGEVIEILDDDEEDVLNEYEREEVLVKIEPDQTAVGATTELESDMRRSGRIKIANRQFEDYQLYTTVEDEEQLILATVDENSANDEEDEEVLAAVAHLSWFITKKRKELRGRRKRNISPSQGNISWRWALSNSVNEGKQL